MYINGVPNKISRKALIGLIESLGLNPKETVQLEISNRAIVVEVYARNEKFERFVSGEELATHTLTIEVTDDDD